MGITIQKGTPNEILKDFRDPKTKKQFDFFLMNSAEYKHDEEMGFSEVIEDLFYHSPMSLL